MKRLPLPLLLLLLLCGPAVAQTGDVPIGPDVRVGTLDNGLTYYVRQNGRPENRAELRLVVDAGSILEDEDQQGLAHFVEHMAFNGTTDFPRQKLIDYIESVGMRFGPDVNAYTSFDETVYMLQVPTDSLELLTTGLHVLREWAGEVTFEDSEIDKERGVVVEEWRLGRGADARMRDVQLPVMLSGSRYADRLPIGKVEVIENASYDTVRRFYREWYRPGLMAVVAVGDFDPDMVENRIAEMFGDLEPASGPQERVEYDVPLNAETLVAVATDPEASRSTVRVIYKLPDDDLAGEAELRRSLVERLHDGMFNERLSELAQQADPPFVIGLGSTGDLVRNAPVYNLLALVPESGVERGLEALLTEAERVRRFGFTSSELERQKTDVLRGYERAFAERDKTDSRSYAAEYIRHFLQDEQIPGIAFEYEFAQRMLPGITLDEVNHLSTEWLASPSRVITADGPEKEDLEPPTEEGLLAVFERVAATDLDPYEDAVSDAPLVAETPEPAAVVEIDEDPGVGVIRVLLENGVRLVMKPTDFQNDQVLLYAYSPGGHSLVSESEYQSASAATAVVGSSGIGEFGPVELQKKLAGKVVNVSPWISEDSEGFRGSASTQDVETMLQLVHLYFTAPRLDPTAYASFQTRMRGMMQNRGASPQAAFSDTLTVTLWNHHPRREPNTIEDLDEMDPEVMERVFGERITDADDFTFYIVGAFDVQDMIGLAATWLGSLSSTDRTEEARDVGARLADGVITKEVRKGIEPQSQVRLMFTGDFEWARENRQRLDALASAFRIKLREVLREDLGGTYGVSVGASATREPEPYYVFSISFGCDPERTDELVSTVFTQIDSLRTEGLDETYLQKVHETELRAHEVALEENSFWLNGLSRADRYGEDTHALLTGDAPFFATLEPADLAAAARRYLDLSNYVQVVLRPTE